MPDTTVPPRGLDEPDLGMINRKHYRPECDPGKDILRKLWSEVRREKSDSGRFRLLAKSMRSLVQEKEGDKWRKVLLHMGQFSMPQMYTEFLDFTHNLILDSLVELQKMSKSSSAKKLPVVSDCRPKPAILDQNTWLEFVMALGVPVEDAGSSAELTRTSVCLSGRTSADHLRTVLRLLDTLKALEIGPVRHLSNLTPDDRRRIRDLLGLYLQYPQMELDLADGRLQGLWGKYTPQRELLEGLGLQQCKEDNLKFIRRRERDGKENASPDFSLSCIELGYVLLLALCPPSHHETQV
ncbi:Hypp4019 [Branchiostoma lanceolatum]|uniref:Hypp4019 protein n=1 Tax=Branchiostoma lanceolatum TaxID=7740 RepID=A0A8K0A7L6_BRALA|nr:Hypp4019 [Branchiostoma lanceolatum]